MACVLTTTKSHKTAQRRFPKDIHLRVFVRFREIEKCMKIKEAEKMNRDVRESRCHDKWILSWSWKIYHVTPLMRLHHRIIFRFSSPSRLLTTRSLHKFPSLKFYQSGLKFKSQFSLNRFSKTVVTDDLATWSKPDPSALIYNYDEINFRSFLRFQFTLNGFWRFKPRVHFDTTISFCVTSVEYVE